MVGLVIIGIIAGVLAGMFGIGGGVVIVPALTIFMGFETVEAISTSLAALLLPVGVFAVLAYHRKGLFSVRTAAWVAVGLAATTFLGAEITLALPTATLRKVYGFFLLIMAWRFIEPRVVWHQWRTANGTSTPPPLPLPKIEARWYSLLGVGLFAGIMSGMFGIGGGIVIVPILAMLLHFDTKEAAGTSLGALLLPVGLPGVLRYASEGVLDWRAAALVAAGLVAGSIIGANVALSLPAERVKRLYGVFLLLVALRFLLQ